MVKQRKEKGVRKSSFVKLRTKERANGRKVLYLDIYKDGKRQYEFLNLYLIQGTDAHTKMLNDETMRKARSIQCVRELEVISSGKVPKIHKESLTLADWMDKCTEVKKQNGQSINRAQCFRIVRQHLIDFSGEQTRLADIDKDYCKRFIKYLSSRTAKNASKHPKTLNASTCSIYFDIFKTALNRAQKEGYIDYNPATLLVNEEKRPIKKRKSNRTYLDIDELRKLIDTDINNKHLKNAFLFACFTGLRKSDIIQLTWDNIITRNNKKHISKIIQKTQQHFDIKLSQQALKWLPPKVEGQNNIFDISKHGGTVPYQLNKWAEKAGITKKICFHTSRHTFATMELTLGADLYTVSKLLGHSNISTTQIYAEIVDKKKEDAVDLTDNLF